YEPSSWPVIKLDRSAAHGVCVSDPRAKILERRAAGAAKKDLGESGELLIGAPLVEVEDDAPRLIGLVVTIGSRHNHESFGKVDAIELPFHDAPRQRKVADPVSRAVRRRDAAVLSAWTDGFAVARLEICTRHSP